jgi:hypothetical protein
VDGLPGFTSTRILMALAWQNIPSKALKKINPRLVAVLAGINAPSRSLLEAAIFLTCDNPGRTRSLYPGCSCGPLSHLFRFVISLAVVAE